MKKFIKTLIVLFALFLIPSSYAKDIQYNQFNDFYTPAFQLIWNDFSDKVVKHNVEFVGGNPALVDNLNQRKLTETMISKKDLYKAMGSQTFATKRRIERNLMWKFHEKSALLDSIDWQKKADERIVLFAMFKKSVYFVNAFKKLTPESFNNSSEKYEYFGVISEQNNYEKYITPVFYNNNNDYAVALKTKSGDEIILQTSNSTEPVLKIWDKLYSNHLSKQSNLAFDENSKLIVPNIDFKKKMNYKELVGKRIKNSNYIIDAALENIEFSLDNEGAKIKNEAIMGVSKMAFNPLPQKVYNFNKPFILFIRSKDANVPYFALKIKDTQYLEKHD